MYDAARTERLQLLAVARSIEIVDINTVAIREGEILVLHLEQRKSILTDFGREKMLDCLT